MKTNVSLLGWLSSVDTLPLQLKLWFFNCRRQIRPYQCFHRDLSECKWSWVMDNVLQRVAMKVCLCRPFDAAAFANDFMPFLISAFTVVAAYTSFYLENDYPVSKVLREPVFVEVEVLDIIDPLVHLTLDRCWTTTSANPDEWPQWDILINGYLILLFFSLFQRHFT